MKTKQVVAFPVNGIEKTVFVRNADTVLHVLRQQMGLTGTKPSCHNGDCGACTILVNGIPQNACHILAVEASGQAITTIEGLTDSTVQEAFIKNWAIQCGYCTPGFILNTYGLMTNNPNADDAVIADWLDANICRCTGYQEIKETVKSLLQEAKTAKKAQ